MSDFKLRMLVGGPMCKSSLILAFVEAIDNLTDEGFVKYFGDQKCVTSVTLNVTMRNLSGKRIREKDD